MLKILGLVVGCVIIILIVLITRIATRPAVDNDYYKKKAAVGELERKYRETGIHLPDKKKLQEFMLKEMKEMEI